MTLPGATADRDEAAYAVIGAPLDRSTTGQPGTRFGPREVRELARGFEDYDHRTNQRFTDLSVHDHGDIGLRGDAREYLTFLESLVTAYASDGVVPTLIGGEHTVALGGIRALAPDIVVCLDAHLDLRAAYADDPLSHAAVNRRVLETANRVVVLGARAGSQSGWERAADSDVTVVKPAAVAGWTPPAETDQLYLSVDIDVADPSVAPGTGTPEPFGLEPATIHEIVRTVAPRAVGFDIVEVNDRDNGQAAVLAAKLLRAFVFAHAAGP
ncbi:MAG: agmatinase [halophilic archaeon J07HX5]|nr:MAG: agmatinase [halophilic archaeon J07HX5]